MTSNLCSQMLIPTVAVQSNLSNEPSPAHSYEVSTRLAAFKHQLNIATSLSMSSSVNKPPMSSWAPSLIMPCRPPTSPYFTYSSGKKEKPSQAHLDFDIFKSYKIFTIDFSFQRQQQVDYSIRPDANNSNQMHLVNHLPHITIEFYFIQSMMIVITSHHSLVEVFLVLLVKIQILLKVSQMLKKYKFFLPILRKVKNQVRNGHIHRVMQNSMFGKRIRIQLKNC